jgi:hypothetical protein
VINWRIRGNLRNMFEWMQNNEVRGSFEDWFKEKIKG